MPWDGRPEGLLCWSLCPAGSWPHQKEFAQFGDQVAKESLERAGGGSWGCGKCSGPCGDI